MGQDGAPEDTLADRVRANAKKLSILEQIHAKRPDHVSDAAFGRAVAQLAGQSAALFTLAVQAPSGTGSARCSFPTTTRPRSRSSWSSRAAIGHLLEAWHANNEYPSGRIHVAIQSREQPAVLHEHVVETDNATKTASQWMARVGTVVGLLALAATAEVSVR